VFSSKTPSSSMFRLRSTVWWIWSEGLVFRFPCCRTRRSRSSRMPPSPRSRTPSPSARSRPIW
jgi:hypothetical protein